MAHISLLDEAVLKVGGFWVDYEIGLASTVSVNDGQLKTYVVRATECGLALGNSKVHFGTFNNAAQVIEFIQLEMIGSRNMQQDSANVVTEYCSECKAIVKCIITGEITDIKNRTYTVNFTCLPSGHKFSKKVSIKSK